MKVNDFLELDKSGAMYDVVDARKTGYVTFPSVLISGDRDVVKKYHGESKLIGFAPKTKRTIIIYVLPESEQTKGE